MEGRLVATGVQAFLTRPAGPSRPGEERERAAFANRTGADLFLSLAVDAATNPDACGVSSYFFGDADPETWSSAGERFAGLVQREIVARTDLVDLRTHAKTWDLLRNTRMPAVRLDVGYLTNAGDAARLRDPEFRDMLAEAIVVAVQRFYLAPRSTPAPACSASARSARASAAERLAAADLSAPVGAPSATAAARRACRHRRQQALEPRSSSSRRTAWCAGPSASAG